MVVLPLVMDTAKGADMLTRTVMTRRHYNGDDSLARQRSLEIGMVEVGLCDAVSGLWC
jgi:hypothetical protein